MGKIKDFFKNLINKFKGKDEKNPNPDKQLIIRTFKNGVKINYVKVQDVETIKNFCGIIQNFSKWDDYNIVYDIPQNTINIYYSVKKSADFEEIKNDKEDKK